MGHYNEIVENSSSIISIGYKDGTPKNRSKLAKKGPRRGKMG